MADLHKYQQMQATGATPSDIYRAAQQDGLGEVGCIRLIRQLFQLSLLEAKEAMVRASEPGVSLQAHQARLVPALEQALTPSLQQGWQVTTQHLKQARTMLPLSAASQKEQDTIARYEHWLEHNELELALDELEAIGEDQDGSLAFWQELLAAAQTMGLTEHIQRYQAKIDDR